MNNNPFVKYLNTLHNVDAENPSAYTEMCITSPFFSQIMVQREVGNFIDSQLNSEKPHVFILTGHAGDGKTAILYQVMQKWGVLGKDNRLSDIADVKMPNGCGCRCIKDFSELEAEKRQQIFRDVLALPQEGKSAFLVANTGPLISTFSSIMAPEELDKLVGAIDDNTAEILDYSGIPISAVNVATLDNSSFVEPFLGRILDSSLWSACQSCEKASFCPILMNRQIMANSEKNISEFISDHYVWQQEHGNKLTIRQIVAHLSYTITSGLQCSQIKNVKGMRYRHLCTNSFFGYCGVRPDTKASSIKAISDVVSEAYDQKKLRADEQLFIKNDLSALPEDVQTIFATDGVSYHLKDGWQPSVRRAYIFLNNEQDSEKRNMLKQDAFSPWFPRFLELRAGSNPTAKDKDLVIDALKMLFLGSLSADNEIPVTMRREENSTQCVQLVYDNIQKKHIKLLLQPVTDFGTKKKYKLYISVKSEKISTALSLPLMNYFEEMRRGAIQTNIDPQLSQGIDSIRAQLIALSESDESDMEMRIITTSGWDPIKASYDDGIWYIN